MFNYYLCYANLFFVQTTNGFLLYYVPIYSPREEKLYELGWNENCYFHGNAETYMTLPSFAQRKESNIFMNRFRGDDVSAGQLSAKNSSSAVGGSGTVGGGLATATMISSFPDDKTITLSREDFDWYANQDAVRAVSIEEDLFLPRFVPTAIRNLPSILRQNIITTIEEGTTHKTAVIGSPSSSLLLSTPPPLPASIQDDIDYRKEECCNRITQHVSDYILPTKWSDRTKWAYGKFGYAPNEYNRTQLVLECMPFLRHIAIIEKAAEFADDIQKVKAKENGGTEDNNDGTRRSSRRTTRSRQNVEVRRHHYFDKLSMTLRRNEADLNSNEVGKLFATGSIIYHPKK